MLLGQRAVLHACMHTAVLLFEVLFSLAIAACASHPAACSTASVRDGSTML